MFIFACILLCVASYPMLIARNNVVCFLGLSVLLLGVNGIFHFTIGFDFIDIAENVVQLIGVS